MDDPYDCFSFYSSLPLLGLFDPLWFLKKRKPHLRPTCLRPQEKEERISANEGGVYRSTYSV